MAKYRAANSLRRMVLLHLIILDKRDGLVCKSQARSVVVPSITSSPTQAVDAAKAATAPMPALLAGKRRNGRQVRALLVNLSVASSAKMACSN